MSKKSIRFFNNREVRAIWDDDHNKWWFSAIDIVRAINDEDDYKKCRNYWKYLKGKMAKDGIELVSVTNHFKFQAPDGMLPKTYTMFADDLLRELLRIFNNKTIDEVGGDIIGRIYEYFLSKSATPQRILAEGENSATVQRKFVLSWNHYQILSHVDNSEARNFYEIEAFEQQWSIRFLGCQHLCSTICTLSSRQSSVTAKAA